MIIYGQEIGSFSYELFLAWCCALAPEIVKPQNNSRYDSQKKHIKKHIPSSNLEAHQYSSDPFVEPVRPYKPHISPLWLHEIFGTQLSGTLSAVQNVDNQSDTAGK